jgi:hypothetical protein
MPLIQGPYELFRSAAIATSGRERVVTNTPMFSAYMLGGTGSATVNIYGAPLQGSPGRLLGTLTPSSSSTPTAYLDSFKVDRETYFEVWADVTAVTGTVVVGLGE